MTPYRSGMPLHTDLVVVGVSDVQEACAGVPRHSQGMLELSVHPFPIHVAERKEILWRLIENDREKKRA